MYNLLPDNIEKEFFHEYLELFINRVAHSTMAYENTEGDPNNYANALILKDNMKEAKELLDTYKKRALTEELIMRIAYRVNFSDKQVSFGYRKKECIYKESDIPTIAAKDIEKKMRSLIRNYKTKWKELDPYLREAMFHIDFIRIHPFHDGNCRTAILFLNHNLLKQKMFPVVISTDMTLEYQICINTLDYEALAKIFRKQSQLEKEVFTNLQKNYNKKTNE